MGNIDRRCVLTRKDVQKTPLADEFAIARMLVAKGFVADGGPLQPRLRGQIGYTLDPETGDYHYFQINALKDLELLAAVNDADAAMMRVVKLLYERRDPRASTMCSLQSRFCASLQQELSNQEPEHD